MVKKSKLMLALDAHKGRDYDAEKRKKQVKAAEKRKRKRAEAQLDDADGEDDKENISTLAFDAENHVEEEDVAPGDFEAFSSGGEDGENATMNGTLTVPQPDTVVDASDSEAEQESDVPLSDLDEEDREDTVPHQRMTINNGAALSASRKRIAVVSDKPKQPFHYHNSLVSSDKSAAELIPDAMDDETRELMFYKIARDATITARKLLKVENIPFARPEDYFAEMVKSEEHMGKVKKKLYDEASSKKAAEEARKLRDAKKFGKQVQIAKEQERAKDRKTTMNKIQELKRKRKGTDTGRVAEGDDMFQEIDVDNAPSRDRSGRERGPGAQPNAKRQKKDSKFGFGGKKRHSKSGTAESSADMRDFSVKRMKGKASGRSAKRPGKSRRAAARS